MDQKVNACDMENYGKGSGLSLGPARVWLGTVILKPNPKYQLNFQREIVLETDKEIKSDEHPFSMGKGTPLTPVHVARELTQ